MANRVVPMYASGLIVRLEDALINHLAKNLFLGDVVTNHLSHNFFLQEKSLFFMIFLSIHQLSR